MGALLDKAASYEAMNRAWQLLRNDRGLWQGELPVTAMRRDVLLHVGGLSKALMDGSYRPETMRCFSVPKADGKERTICASAVRDKLAQRAVLTVLEPLGEAVFLRDSFGFRPNCTVDMALARVRELARDGYEWLVDADIRQCFDAIPQAGALRQLKRLCGDRELVAVTRRWLEAVPRPFQPLGAGRGLPQGMVLSPFLCNLYLHQMDRFLAARGIPFVRFADDFLLLLRDRRAAEKAQRRVAGCLERLGLELHPDKTRVVRCAGRHRFLGRRLPDIRRIGLR